MTGADLTLLRNDAALTQQQLAHLMSCSTASIAQWESGRRAIRPWVARELARILSEGAARAVSPQ